MRESTSEYLRIRDVARRVAEPTPKQRRLLAGLFVFVGLVFVVGIVVVALLAGVF